MKRHKIEYKRGEKVEINWEEIQKKDREERKERKKKGRGG